jgi:hypothetical protein
MGIAFVYQLSLAAVAMLLCLMSMTTSRRHRHTHLRYMALSGTVVAAALLGALVDAMLDAADEIPYDPTQALMPFCTVVLCLVPIWRAQQAKRRREETLRYRRATSTQAR